MILVSNPIKIALMDSWYVF